MNNVVRIINYALTYGMSMKKWYILSLLFLTTIQVVFASNPESETLRSAGTTFRNSAFRAESSHSGQTAVIEKKPREFSFSGFLQRDGSLIEHFEINQNGSFFQVGDTITQFPKHIPVEWFGIISSTSQFANNPRSIYKISDSRYGNVSCWLLSVQIPDDKESTNMLEKRFPGRDLRVTRANYPFKGLYLIGKEYPFVYSYAIFNRDGKRTVALDWGNVDFNADMEPIVLSGSAKVNSKDNAFVNAMTPFLFPNDLLSAAEKGYTDAYEVKGLKRNSSPTGYDLLIDSRDATRNANYIAEVIIDDPAVYGKKIFQKQDANTGIVLSREETYFNNQLNTPAGISITTVDGTYLVTDKIIVKSNDMKQYMSTFLQRAYRYLPPDGNYRVGSARYNGIDCYKITVTISPDSQYLANLQRQWKDAGTLGDISFFPFTQVYLIDKNSKFLYSYQAFGQNQEMLFTRNMGNVNFVSPQDDLFVLPDGKITKVDDYYELKKVVQRAHGNNAGSLVSQISSIPSAMVNSVERNFHVLTKWGSRITLFIAILSVSLIVFIKVKSYRGSNHTRKR